MKQLLMLLALTACLLTGCGAKETPEQEPPEPPVTEQVEEPALPEAFPLTLHFSSGAGGWGTELTLQRDGSFTGQYHDSEMGSVGENYPNGSYYLCDFEGRFGDFREAEYGSVALTLEELTVVTEQTEPWIEDGILYIPSTPYGLEGGTDFLLCSPFTPVDTLTESGLMGWPLMGEDTDTLGLWALHNVTEDQTFFDWAVWDAAEAESGQEPAQTGAEAMAVYETAGIRIALPSDLIPQLLVEVPQACGEESPHSLTLMTVREKASAEAAEADFGSGEGFGFLFGISRLDQTALEELLQYDIPGCAVFATDGTHYYALTTPTDVQFHRSGDALYDVEELRAWHSLCALAESVPADLIVRNDLTPYDHRDLYEAAFTYSGTHSYVNYYPYFTADGSYDNFETLVLSQPVTQGVGGIWCVERIIDAHGNTSLIFPQQDIPAAKWYAARQAAHDAGTESHLLMPLDAAEEFLRSSGRTTGNSAEGSLEETSSMDEEYIEANRNLDRVLPSLLTGSGTEEADLLACLAAFRDDTWAFMGRSYYGSDWWPPLLSAVEHAAIGEGQEARCAALQNFYLTSCGRYEEALRPLLRAQFESAPEAANAALSVRSEAEQTAVRAALEG